MIGICKPFVSILPFSINRAAIPKGRPTVFAIAVVKEKGLVAVAEEHPTVFVKFYKGLTVLYDMGLRHSQAAPGRDVTLLYGPPGCGKTSTFIDNEKEGCVLSAASGWWFDGSRQEEAVLLDDFDGKASKWTLCQTLQTFDRYQIRVPIKGSFTWWCPKRIYITTNLHPRKWFEWADREEQWGALTRRFNKIITWDRAGLRRELNPLRDREAWGRFWDLPTAFMPGADTYNYF